MTRLLLLFALLCTALAAQTAYTTGTSHQFKVGIIPSSAAVAVQGTVYLESVVIVNNSGSSITVSLTDRGTACGGSACNLTPASLSVAANTVYVIPFRDDVAPNGVTWSSSDGTNVTGRIHYRTTLNVP